jgi:YD repeat-containing protein
MKNQFKTMILFVAVLFTIGCTKEDDTTPGGGNTSGVQLTKITAWNPTTNVETSNLELTYNTAGVVTSATGTNGDIYALEYDAAGKLTKVTKTNPNGRGSVSVYEYNTATKVSKITEANTSSGNSTGTTVFTFEYNTTGKIVKKIATYTGGSSTSEYTWVVDNISEIKLTNLPGTGFATFKYPSYDDKLNPLSLGGDFIGLSFYSNPPSKNNFLEMTTTPSTGTATTEKRTYEYNTLNYPTTMRVTGSTTVGQKYYYK